MRTLLLITGLFLLVVRDSSFLDSDQLLQFAKNAQQVCLQTLPPSSQNLELLSMILCGQDSVSSPHIELFKKTQLIHILVISGSHLLFFDFFLKFLKTPFFARAFIIGGFSIFTGLNPPCTRALLSLFFIESLKTSKTRISQDTSTLIIGLLTLIFFPQWWNSRSLLLSWTASLGLSLYFLYDENPPKVKIFITQLSIYLLMILPLWGISSLHPLGILINLTLAPLLGVTLIPLSLLAVLVTSFVPYFDQILYTLFKVLKWCSLPITEPPTHIMNVNLKILWTYVFATQALIHLLRITTLQENLKKKKFNESVYE